MLKGAVGRKIVPTRRVPWDLRTGGQRCSRTRHCLIMHFPSEREIAGQWFRGGLSADRTSPLQAVRRDHPGLCLWPGQSRIAKKTIESPVAAALALTAHGIDLVATLHLTSRPAGAVFVSFDKSSFGARDAGTRGVSASQVKSSQVKN